MELAVNAYDAGAALVVVKITSKGGLTDLAVLDDGAGIDKYALERVSIEGYSGKGGSGLGLSKVRKGALECGGKFEILSKRGAGTEVYASYRYGYQMGDIGGTVAVLCDEDVDIVVEFDLESGEFVFDTRELRSKLRGESIGNPRVKALARRVINENIENL